MLPLCLVMLLGNVFCKMGIKIIGKISGNLNFVHIIDLLLGSEICSQIYQTLQKATDGCYKRIPEQELGALMGIKLLTGLMTCLRRIHSSYQKRQLGNYTVKDISGVVRISEWGEALQHFSARLDEQKRSLPQMLEVCCLSSI